MELAQPIDIVMTSRNRVEYTKQTIECILEKTRTPYHLHVIDDNSTDGTVDYLMGLWREKKICDLVLRGRRAGLTANDNLRNWLSFSDPFIIWPDDALVPDVEPDWIERGIIELLNRTHGENRLGELDLNHPGADRMKRFVDGAVTYCEITGGLGFLRREVVPIIRLAHFRDNFGQGSEIQRCSAMKLAGWNVGYLTETFTYHLGRKSLMMEGKTYGSFIEPIDWKTLRPPEEWVWV
jgi:glycosyltransferase involved in cell wall biosynthesis